MASQHIDYVIPPESKAFCDSIGYAEGVKVGNMLYLAGQVGWNPATGKVAEGGLREQVRGAFTNMKKIIEHAGGTIDGVVQLMSFLADKGGDRPLMGRLQHSGRGAEGVLQNRKTLRNCRTGEATGAARFAGRTPGSSRALGPWLISIHNRSTTRRGRRWESGTERSSGQESSSRSACFCFNVEALRPARPSRTWELLPV